MGIWPRWRGHRAWVDRVGAEAHERRRRGKGKPLHSVEGHATCVISSPYRSFRGRPLRQIVQWLTRVLHSPNSGRSCKLASSA
jgi:hypothetical protein